MLLIAVMSNGFTKHVLYLPSFKLEMLATLRNPFLKLSFLVY